MLTMMAITMTEADARRLWEKTNEDPEAVIPLGQDLADWVAEFAQTTLESTWQFDAGVCPDAKSLASSDTLLLLTEIGACDEQLKGHNLSRAARVGISRRREALKAELVGPADAFDDGEKALRDIQQAYFGAKRAQERPRRGARRAKGKV